MSSIYWEPALKKFTKVMRKQRNNFKISKLTLSCFCLGELFIIVEYCQFGNLQSFLIKNRKSFINQVDESGNPTTDTVTADETDNYPIIQQDSRCCVVSSFSDKFNQSDSSFQTDTFQPMSTKDLVSWSFQIARGMGYLASRKVLQYRLLSQLNNI